MRKHFWMGMFTSRANFVHSLDEVERPFVPLKQVGLHEAGLGEFTLGRASNRHCDTANLGRPDLIQALICYKVLPFCTVCVTHNHKVASHSQGK